MENIVIDQRIQIQHLEQANEALKKKIVLIYSNWDYDNQKYQELKITNKEINQQLKILILNLKKA